MMGLDRECRNPWQNSVWAGSAVCWVQSGRLSTHHRIEKLENAGGREGARSMFNRIRGPLAASLAVAVTGIWIASAPALAYSGQRTRRVAARPRTPYAQGYQKGYSSGYLAGLADWRKGVPRDFQHSGTFQSGEQQAGQTASAPGKY